MGFSPSSLPKLGLKYLKPICLPLCSKSTASVSRFGHRLTTAGSKAKHGAELRAAHRDPVTAAMGSEAKQLPRIDFSGVVPSAPGSGTWSAVRGEVMDALATFGCFEAHYPALTPQLRAELFDGAVRPLFALPVDTKRRNYYGDDKPFHGYVGKLPGYDGFESVAVVDGTKDEAVRDFAGLMWPDGGDSNAAFCGTVGAAARCMFELEEAVRRMVMEGLGVAKYHDALSASLWPLFRMSEYKAPNAAEKMVRYMTHQDTNFLSLVCQHEVEGLEMQMPDGEWVVVKPSPASLVVMVGNALRAWTNERLHAPFHRVTVAGDVTRYSAILFSVPDFKIQAPDELVDDEHPPRFKPHDNADFVRFCVSEEGARHEDKLKAFCGV